MYVDRRAGVGQASREETAARTAVEIEGYGAMAIRRRTALVMGLARDVRCAVKSRQCGRSSPKQREHRPIACR